MQRQDTWADCLGRAASSTRQAEAEATEKALDSLLAHGVVEDVKRVGATNFKFLTTHWENGWRMKDGCWKMKVRFVSREYKWAEHREDLFSPGSYPFCWSRDRLPGVEVGLGNV